MLSDLIDANGIVNVSAKDKASGKEQTIRIEASGGLTDADIQRMVKEGEVNAEADKKRKALAEARNVADGAIYAAEKALKDAPSGAPGDIRAEVEKAIAAAKDAVKGEDAGRIAKAGEAAAQAAGRLAELAQAPGPTGHSPEADANVVDAEFEEVDKRARKAG